MMTAWDLVLKLEDLKNKQLKISDELSITANIYKREQLMRELDAALAEMVDIKLTLKNR